MIKLFYSENQKKLITFLSSLLYFSMLDGVIIKIIYPLIDLVFENNQSKMNKLFINTRNISDSINLYDFSKDELLFLLEHCVFICGLDGLTNKEILELKKLFKSYGISEDEINNIFSIISSELSLIDLNTRLLIFQIFIKGYLFYLNNGFTPYDSYVAMRLLFYISNKRFNNIVALINSYFSEKYSFLLESNLTSNFIGDFTNDKIKSISEELYEEGYYILGCIDESKIDFIEKLLLDSSYKYRNDKVVKDIIADNYLNNRIIKEILFDDVLMAIAQNYIGSIPILEDPRSWITYYKDGIPSSESAQLYHCDIDRLRQLKMFIMITDVDEDSGPHCFVRHSHKKLPFSLLKDGRYLDEEVNKEFKKDDIIKFCVKKGTILLEDTSGIHKGMHITNKDKIRIIFQVCYSLNLFGQNYDKCNLVRENWFIKYERSCKSYNLIF